MVKENRLVSQLTQRVVIQNRGSRALATGNNPTSSRLTIENTLKRTQCPLRSLRLSWIINPWKM
jgi:hypothetical protein